MTPAPVLIVSGGPTVTDWIQAGASVLSVIVTVVAAVVGLLARRAGKRGERSGREALNLVVSTGNDEANSRLRAEGKTVWQISADGKNSRVFTNTGSQDVKLVRVTDVTEPRGAVMVLRGYEGTYISPGNGFRVVVERSLADPLVSQVEVTWEEGARTVTQVYAVS